MGAKIENLTFLSLKENWFQPVLTLQFIIQGFCLYWLLTSTEMGN